MDDCIFCKIVSGIIPSQNIYEDDNVLAFNDINPVSPNHILIIPKKHIAMVSELEKKDSHIMGELFLAAKKIAENLNILDYRLVINNGKNVGQSVFHVHIHLLSGRFFSWPPG